ncbi:MAG: alanine:cation symporter family protein [Candidatus Methanomethylophilaceae archaeon]|nr:alanine:cation symporter family protein [Candidatus Methanomethylophilaceae archaeon]
MSISQTLTDIFTPLNTYIWYIAFVFLVGLGLYFFIRLKALPILKIKETSKLSLSGTTEGDSSKTVSSFEAFCIGIGARVGVGNIAGVAGAIIAGGPGAIFWMWIFAIIGSASSFMESTLSQIFKEKKEDGQFHSGPAYYVQKGLKSRPLAIVLAIMIVITFGIGFVGVQSANSVSALANAFQFENSLYVFAAIVAFATALIIFGGVKRIATFSAKVVPAMAVLWLLLGAVVIVMNYDHIIDAITMIFTYAFQWESAAGGLLGAVIMNGLKRGVFSNEAGLGSIANIAGTADVKHPVKQGMIQSFGTLVDTLVVCTFSAMVILTTFGSYEAILATGVSKGHLIQLATEVTLGDIGPILVSLFVFIFAFTSLIGYYTMSESNIRFVSDNRATVFAVRILVIVVAFVSAIAGADLMELICDTFMAAMGAVNMICVFLLSKYAFKAYEDWKEQQAAGVEDPVFHRSILGEDSGATEWE